MTTRQERWARIAEAIRTWLDTNGLEHYGISRYTGDMLKRLRIECRGRYYEPIVRLSIRIDGDAPVTITRERDIWS